ncbi:nuclear pore complex protein NUP93B-like [Humulus lupulus]|uniref:nuclear pore complex protein NUP93B-like n=1 Tax=Humulus lupulus TaxID=3486 RepID=UPI002B417087|nr:nuclear pore complex protein NUP93B-like [Humulus lupulus]
MTSSPQASSGASSMQLVPLANNPILEKKAAVYAEVVKNLNDARERGLPFKLSRVLMSLIIGARRHLERGHEKYVVDTIQSHPAQLSKSTSQQRQVHN